MCSIATKRYIFNFELNCRVSNGMHGGVRGRSKSALLDYISVCRVHGQTHFNLHGIKSSSGDSCLCVSDLYTEKLPSGRRAARAVKQILVFRVRLKERRVGFGLVGVYRIFVIYQNKPVRRGVHELKRRFSGF